MNLHITTESINSDTSDINYQDPIDYTSLNAFAPNNYANSEILLDAYAQLPPYDENIQSTNTHINNESNSNSEISNENSELISNNKAKRKHENTQAISNISKKRTKTCKSIKSSNPRGRVIKKDIQISEENIRKYNALMNTFIFCYYCGNRVSVSKIFKYDKNVICRECGKEYAKERKLKITDFKEDYFEQYKFKGEVLYKCKRLKHARPLYHFMKYCEKTNSYRIVTNCCYCRNYKSIEVLFKSE